MPRSRLFKAIARRALARRHLFWLSITAAAPALAAAPEPARQPHRPAAASELASPGRSGGRSGLPRQFTVELTRDGAIFADGARARSVEDVEARGRNAIASPSFFAGAAVFSDSSDEARLTAVFAALKRAGFATIRSVRRGAPAELSAAAPVYPAAPALEKTSEARPGVLQRSGAGGGDVEVLSVGLHVAGPLGQEPHRSRLLRAFERQFDVFGRCHPLASERQQNASFGVDLLVPTKGGRAAVRQTRTRLTGDGFKACMQRAFESIKFDPPPAARPEMVSYSLLFKPTAQ